MIHEFCTRTHKNLLPFHINSTPTSSECWLRKLCVWTPYWKWNWMYRSRNGWTTSHTHAHSPPAMERGGVKLNERNRWQQSRVECVVGEITRAAKTEKCESRWTRTLEKFEGPIGAKRGCRVCAHWSPSVREPFLMVNLATVSYHTAFDRYLIAKFNHCVTRILPDCYPSQTHHYVLMPARRSTITQHC